MAKGKQRESWNHTASILAFHANLNRDSKKRQKPYTVDDFHPFAKDYRRNKGIRLTKDRVKQFAMLVQAQYPKR